MDMSQLCSVVITESYVSIQYVSMYANEVVYNVHTTLYREVCDNAVCIFVSI